jgi:two-component system chemotaxis response regulator CheB
MIVLGASAGGVRAMRHVLSQLPADLAATVALTLHRSPSASTSLAEVLRHTSRLPVVEPSSPTPTRSGHVYLAPRDHHMSVQGRMLTIDRGPKQHHSRPAIDPLFVSAAKSLGDAVVGGLMSGCLSDGVSGLIEIKARGGITLAQDPTEAEYPEMPMNALLFDHLDLVFRLDALAEVLARLVDGAHVRGLLDIPGVSAPPERRSAARFRRGA